MIRCFVGVVCSLEVYDNYCFVYWRAYDVTPLGFMLIVLLFGCYKRVTPLGLVFFDDDNIVYFIP